MWSTTPNEKATRYCTTVQVCTKYWWILHAFLKKVIIKYKYLYIVQLYPCYNCAASGHVDSNQFRRNSLYIPGILQLYIVYCLTTFFFNAVEDCIESFKIKLPLLYLVPKIPSDVMHAYTVGILFGCTTRRSS
jgi:hypothetical protein